MGHSLALEATAELDRIWYYIASETGDIGRADRLIDVITERFYLLSRYPRLGRIRPDLRPELRSFSVGDYIILYRIVAEDVLILHVFHGRQDIQAHL